ncbi:hypothetical protein LZ31DRAFT_553449 [Colletotrichum somersetense]|nr:hypothetical protein LZ31DRAFT_553449 [Colletotrichum somersetense]
MTRWFALLLAPLHLAFLRDPPYLSPGSFTPPQSSCVCLHVLRTLGYSRACRAVPFMLLCALQGLTFQAKYSNPKGKDQQPDNARCLPG